tara:strand:- start:355 stop:561 length:207 start_codon:yes stop_codon:yes gene_type:complete
MKALFILLILIFMQMGCTGLVVYEIVSSSQFITDEQHESVPVVNVRVYYDKPDKSKLYPEPKSKRKGK